MHLIHIIVLLILLWILLFKMLDKTHVFFWITIQICIQIDKGNWILQIVMILIFMEILQHISQIMQLLFNRLLEPYQILVNMQLVIINTIRDLQIFYQPQYWIILILLFNLIMIFIMDWVALTLKPKFQLFTIKYVMNLIHTFIFYLS